MSKRSLIIFSFGIGITLIAAGLFPFFSQVSVSFAQPEATAEAAPAVTPENALETAPETTQTNAAVEPTGDNSYCAVCHDQPWRAVTLADGFVFNLYVPVEAIANSVHGEGSAEGQLGCIDCHGENTFPHDGPTPADSRTYTLQSVSMCTNCHTVEADELEHGLHEQAIAAGNLGAAVCTDCHGAHDIQPSANEPQLVAGVCGDCHTSTVEEWRSSPHVDIGPLGCATCHSPHSQELRVSGVTELCENCHNPTTDPTIGGIFIHAQHLESEIEVTCADCHMFRSPSLQVSLVGLGPTGHTMAVDTVPCNTCHEELEVSGVWTDLTQRVDDTLLAERDALQTEVNALQTQLQERETTPEQSLSYVQLIQGLIIGLGVGVTAAAVLILRLSRGRKDNDGEQPGDSGTDSAE
jgi:hypothetical protein